MMENNFNESIDIAVLLHKFNFLLVILEHLYASTFSVHDGL